MHRHAQALSAYIQPAAAAYYLWILPFDGMDWIRDLSACCSTPLDMLHEGTCAMQTTVVLCCYACMQIFGSEQVHHQVAEVRRWTCL